jgi:hypothetical protein
MPLKINKPCHPKTTKPKVEMKCFSKIFQNGRNLFEEISKHLTPKGPWIPYVEFSDSGQAAVNVFYF